ncbi:MAG TPA: VOC family protein [Candidatus Thermoplasmatota archaeon]|jgi:predicted enzyme related to lactoylglutathione lyase|nr:VOC family protein [Candidatus Thermoplasmatota archaeon]
MASGITPVLNVSSVEKSAEFYRGLGLKIKRESMGGMSWSTVRSGDAALLLFPKDAIPEGAPADTAAWLSGELGKGVLISIGVANAKRAWEKAQAMRANVDQPIEANPWGGQSFMLTDPDGYAIQVSDRWPEGPATRKAPRKAPKARGKAPKRGAKKTRKARK